MKRDYGGVTLKYYKFNYFFSMKRGYVGCFGVYRRMCGVSGCAFLT